MVAGKRLTYLWRSVFIVSFVTRHLVKQAQTRLLGGGMDGGGVRRFLFYQAVSQSRVLLLYIFSLTHFYMDTFPQIIIYSLGNRAIKQNTELAKKYKKIKKTKTKNFRILLFPAKLSPRHDNEFLHIGPSVYICDSKFTFQLWVLIPLEILLKMSKISGIGQKLFRWKKAEKIPKKEWPELVGKVWLRFSLSCS